MADFYAQYPVVGTGGGGGGGGTVTSVALTAPASILSVTGSPVTTAGTLALALTTQSANRVWAGPTSGGAATPTFRALVAADLPFAAGDLTDVGTDGIVVTGGTGAVIGSGTSLAQHVADGSHNGYLSSSDWTAFNGKQASGNYITALSGDGVATGPGAVALTLTTVNSNVGSFGSASAVGTFTVNGKGLVTAASNTSIQIAESQVTNLVSDLAGKEPTITILTPTHGGTGLNTSASTGVPSIASGTWSINAQLPVSLGGTGASTLTANNVILGNGSSAPLFVAPGTSGNVLTSNGTTWTSAGIPTVAYFNGLINSGSSSTWRTSSTSFADITIQAGSTSLVTTYSNGVTVTAAASNLPGITFTPPSTTATYIITASFMGANATIAAESGFRLTDGTTAFGWINLTEVNGVEFPTTLNGIYVPGTTSAVTVKIQGITSAGGQVVIDGGPVSGTGIQFTLVMIAP